MGGQVIAQVVLPGGHRVNAGHGEHKVHEVDGAGLGGIVHGPQAGYWLADLLLAARTGTPFPVAENQLSSPTSVTTLSACIVALIESEEYGLFHAADEGVTSRLGFAREVLHSCTMEAPTDQAAAARLRAPMAFTR